MSLANLPVARKLYSAFGIIIAVIIILCGLFYSYFTSVTNANGWNVHTYQVIDEGRALTESLVNMETGLRGYGLVGEDAMLEPYRQGLSAFGQHLAKARSLTSDNARQQERFQRLENQQRTWITNFADPLVVQRKLVGQSTTIDAFITAFKGRTGKADMDAMRATIGEIVNEEASLLSVRAAEVDSLGTKTKTVLIAGVLAATVFGMLMAMWISNLIAPPLRAAVTFAQAIAAGNLTGRITSKTTDEVGTLLHALNDMQEKLIDIVGSIKTSTELVNSGAKEVMAGNIDLSSRTEQQAAAIEETAASMEELTATVKQNADNARQASTLVVNASEMAQNGNAVVSRVVTTMSDINQSSNKIADITSIIEGIAFQTNILALNAAVEAARAGEQGRGFAVVASEVRSLAQRSSTAAKEIKELISDSVMKVQDGSALVDEAGQTMFDLTQAVASVTTIMDEIAAASAEQSKGIDQVAQAVVQMEQVTQQNASLVQEATTAAGSLEAQGRQLGQIISTFQLSAVSRNVAASASRATKSGPIANAPTSSTALRRPNLSAKPAVAAPVAKRSSDSDWESF